MIQNFKLGELFEIQIGKTPARGDKKMWDLNKKSNNIWLSIKDLKQVDANGYISDSAEYISDDGAKLVSLVPKNTLLLSFKLTLGRTAITKIPLRTNEAIAALLPKTDKSDLRYLKYYLEYFDFVKFAKNDFKVKGLTLNKKKLAEIPIPLPPLQEQEKIVKRLDKKSSIIVKRTNLNFKSLINNLFLSHVNNVVKDLYENSPKVAVQDEIYTSDYVANGSFKSLKDNVNTTSKPNFALLVKFNDLSKSKNLKKTFIDESSYNFLKKSNLYEGDLIINNVGANLGQVFIVPNLYKKMSIGPNCIVMRPSNNFLGEYLQIVMNSHYFQTMLSEIFGGAAQPKFNKTNFRSLMFPFIDLDKQNEIVSEIKKIEEIKNKLNENYSNLNELYYKYKQSSLREVFSHE